MEFSGSPRRISKEKSGIACLISLYGFCSGRVSCARLRRRCFHCQRLEPDLFVADHWLPSTRGVLLVGKRQVSNGALLRRLQSKSSRLRRTSLLLSSDFLCWKACPTRIGTLHVDARF